MYVALTAAVILLLFLSILFYQVLKGRRTLLYPSLWKPAPQMTTWTTNGFLGQRLKLQAATKQAHAKGRPKGLAPTLNNLLNEYQIGEGSTQEKAQIITFRPVLKTKLKLTAAVSQIFFIGFLSIPLVLTCAVLTKFLSKFLPPSKPSS